MLREKLIIELNSAGIEWYNSTADEKTNKYMDIIEKMFRLFSPDYFKGYTDRTAYSEATLDKKLNILTNILTSGLAGFDPNIGSLYGYVNFCMTKRFREYGEAWAYDFERAGSTIDWNTVTLSSFCWTDDDGNELNWDQWLTSVDAEFGNAHITEMTYSLEDDELLNFSLSLMSETLLMEKESGKNATKFNVFQLLFSSNLINIAKLQISRRGLLHETEVISNAKQAFFTFCYDSDTSLYPTFEDLEITPLKHNREIYELADSKGLHYELREETADSEIYVPIPSNICIMYLYCVEEYKMTSPMFSQYKKKYTELLQDIKNR